MTATTLNSRRMLPAGGSTFHHPDCPVYQRRRYLTHPELALDDVVVEREAALAQGYKACKRCGA